MATLIDWNQRYQAQTPFPQPCHVLSDNQHLLPTEGIALDLACGLGANALFLAEKGLKTYAWDYSSVAIQRLLQQASQRGLALNTEVRDVIAAPPPPEKFDVIVICHFLERSLAPLIIKALKSDGLLFYQTFTRQKVTAEGPQNPDFLLDDNELLQSFSALRIIVYREESTVGNITQGFRNQALLIGQKK